MVNWISRLQYAWRRHGPIGMITLAIPNIAYHLRGRIRAATVAVRADPFDEEYGTDTAGIREIGSLDVITTAAARSAVRYEPSDGKEVRRALEQLGIEYKDYSFVDFGSGKGRVLLVAAGFPFKKVIGVEFSRELHETALRNVAGVAPHIIQAGEVYSYNGDAASFEPPINNLVCYLYNPFGPPIISQVARRLAAHHQRHGSHVIVIYVDAQHRHAFESTGNFRTLQETSHALILTTPPAVTARS